MARVKLPDVEQRTGTGSLTAITGTVRVTDADTDAAVTVYSARSGGTSTSGTAVVDGGQVSGWVDSGVTIAMYVTPAGQSEQGPFYWEAAAAAASSSGGDLLLEQLERSGQRSVMVSNGSHRADYEDATEWTDSWADLTGFTVNTGVQVSGGKLYGVAGANPSIAKRPLAMGTTGRARIVTTLDIPAAWVAKSLFVGVSFDATIAANSPTLLGIGVTSAGNIGRFMGASYTGGTNAGVTVTNGVAITQGKYLVTINVDETSVGLSLRALSGTLLGQEWTYTVLRSVVPGALTHVAAYNQDPAALTGADIGPISAKLSSATLRTRTVEGQGITTAMSIPSGTERWRIALPTGYDSRKPAPLVMYFHQALTGFEMVPAFESRARPVAEALAAAGFIVASAMDGSASTGSTDGTGDRWGNQASLDNHLALYRYVRDHYAIGPVCFLPVSMGGLPALNLLARRTIPGVVGVYGIDGVYDLDTLNSNGTYSAFIRTAYGAAANGSDYETKTAGYNPADQLGTAFRGVPFRWYVSDSDTNVPRVSNGDALIATVSPYTAEANAVTHTGAHLATASFSASDVVAFFQRAMQTA